MKPVLDALSELKEDITPEEALAAVKWVVTPVVLPLVPYYLIPGHCHSNIHLAQLVHLERGEDINP